MMPHLEMASPQGVNVSTSVAQETNYCRLFPDHFSSLKMLTHLAAQARGTRRDVVAVFLGRRVSGEFDAIGGGLRTEAGTVVCAADSRVQSDNMERYRSNPSYT